MQAVGAEQEAIARRERDEPGVDLDVIAVADRARDHVAVRRSARFFGRDEPLLELPGDERVVLGDLLTWPSRTW